jgi:hypothetical protein
MATITIEEKLLAKQTARNIIRAKLVELGLAESSAKLEALATIIDGIVNQGAVSIQIREGETATIPAGYHNGSGTVSGIAGGGDYKLEPTKTVTPTKSQQSVTPASGFYGLEGVTVLAIPQIYQDVSSVDAKAADVLSGKIIVLADGSVVAGTMPDNGAVNATVDATTVTYTIPKGYHSGSGTVTITLEEKSVTPTKSEQTVTPTTGKVLSKVTVAPIPDAYQDITKTTATEEHVLDGDKFIGADGTEKTGSMPNNGAVTGSVNGITTTEVDVPAGYTSGGKVTFDDTKIAEMLDAI